MFGWLICIWHEIQCFANALGVFLKALVMYPLYHGYELFMSAIVSLLTISLPQSLTNGLQGLSSLGSGVGYFMGLWGVNTGLGIIIACYAIRFFIRRLPVVG